MQLVCVYGKERKQRRIEGQKEEKWAVEVEVKVATKACKGEVEV